VSLLPNGVRVIDAGVGTPGGYGAGIALAAMCMGGLGELMIAPVGLEGESFWGIIVWTDHPAVACMAGQYAGWPISVDEFFAMGSGPLRATAHVERELFETLGYHEVSERGVLVLEGRTLPTEHVANWICEKAGIEPANLTLAIAPTASLGGGVQVVARTIETGLHKMHTLGFDVTKVVSAIGSAPLPPTARSDIRAIGRTNDSVLYGGHAAYTIHASDDELAALAERLPASSSPDYGAPFHETFKRYGGDFYKIDPMLFSPAQVTLTSTMSGRMFRGGRINLDVLRRSFNE
jgi:methenyltetrahydromethanopterin cyclohydrolase